MYKIITEQIRALWDNGFFKQIIRFIITGALSAGLEFFVYTTLIAYFQLHYQYSNVLAFIAANVLNYSLSRNWVFVKGRHSASVEFIAFAVVALIGLGLNILILWALIGHMQVDYRIAKIFAIFIVVIWNFISKKTLVFQS
jgi:putative flippase GtrA